MNRFLLFIALSTCLLQGCGGRGYPENVDLDQAGPVLRTALEAWKEGKSQTDLEKQSPSIIMNEDDWRTGKRLLEFKMEDAGSLLGRQARWRVQIKLQDANGKTQERNATYIIDTTPRVVIVRDTFASM